jgi:TetR/AcrR family transcriptional regulator
MSAPGGPAPTLHDAMTKVAVRADSEHLRKRARAAAVRLFARQGYEGTSVQSIADEVGVSKQALLYHFSSKEGLRQAALEEMVGMWRDVLPRLLSALTGQESGFEEVLFEIVTWTRSEPAYARFLMHELLTEQGASHPVLQDIDPWMKVAADLIRRAQSEGKVRPDVDPEAWLISTATSILITMCLLDTPRPESAPSPDRVVREMARVIGASLLNPPTSG